MWISSSAREKTGFTLIELLVVIAIIGILMTVSVISLSGARRRARDTRRVADIQQVRNALLIYANQRATYPPGTDLALGEGAARCIDDSDAGFRSGAEGDACSGFIIMARVPAEQIPGSPPYLYRRVDVNSYEITFSLEGSVGDLPGGSCVARVDSITCTP